MTRDAQLSSVIPAKAGIHCFIRDAAGLLLSQA
jgi:hypothetical protein